jgi:tetratricopeptide (TPR) repeat protein
MSPTQIQNRYRLDEPIGRGAAGVVHRGRDLRLDRDVAIKVLSRTSFGEDASGRLLREARAAAALNHPGIVAVHDAGDEGESVFIVMELVTGPNLHQRRPLTLAQSIEVGRQLADALAHAHRNGIVHRDLKPENILVAEDGERLGVKIADLGLAIARGSSRTTGADSFVGTALYMAPEQALGGDVDARADLYALGAVLYELVADRPPFQGDHALAVISQHLHAPVVPPRTYRADIPLELEAVILRLLAKQPDKRFASADEVSEALRMIEASPETMPAADASEPVRLLDRLARGRLVGRQTELQQLGDLWARAHRGQGHMALISGEPGVGKTRLARELVVRAQLDGATVLQGGCYEFEATTPYLPFVEALRQWVATQPPEVLRARLGATAPELARLAPEIEAKLGPLPPSVPLAPHEERLRLFDSVARLFQGLAGGGGGLLVLLDDLHWADHGSLALLHYLIRNLRDSRMLVLGAYREVELDRAHPLAAALVDWNRERLATRVPIGRLSLKDTARMLATLFGQDEVSPDFAAAMHRETEGNPFFVEEVVKSLIEHGQIFHRDGEWHRGEVGDLAIPQSVKSAIGRRLDRLTPECTEVLQTAAALGKVFEFAELAAVSSAGEERLLDALDEAATAQLVRVDRADSFAFTHDKIREVLHEELNPIRQRRLHQRIGEGLERLYATQLDTHVQDLAYHFAESSDLRKGFDYSLAAAERSEAVFAHEEALKHCEQARECAEGLEDSTKLAAAFERIGGIHASSGRAVPAAEAYERALALTTDRARRAALRGKIGETYARVGDARGLPHLEAALADFDPATQTLELAMATATLGRYQHYHARPRAALEHLHRARELVEPLDHAPALDLIYGYIAGAYQHMAQFQESVAWARKAIELGRRHGFLHAEATGSEFIAEGCFSLGRWQEGLEAAARDEEIGERIGSQDRVAWSRFAAAQLLRGCGRLADARVAAETGLALATRIGEKRLSVFLCMTLSEVLTDLGEVDEARRQCEAASDLAANFEQITLRSAAAQSVAHWHSMQGDWEAALAVSRPVVEAGRNSENKVAYWLLGPMFSEACAESGRPDEGLTVIEVAIELARASGSEHWLGMSRRVRAQLLAAKGDRSAAATEFDGAVATLEPIGSRLELARALDRRGRLHRSAGDRARGRADLERARDLFAECGAVPERDRAAAALGE